MTTVLLRNEIVIHLDLFYLSLIRLICCLTRSMQLTIAVVLKNISKIQITCYCFQFWKWFIIYIFKYFKRCFSWNLRIIICYMIACLSYYIISSWWNTDILWRLQWCHDINQFSDKRTITIRFTNSQFMTKKMSS